MRKALFFFSVVSISNLAFADEVESSRYRSVESLFTENNLCSEVISKSTQAAITYDLYKPIGIFGKNEEARSKAARQYLNLQLGSLACAYSNGTSEEHVNCLNKLINQYKGEKIDLKSLCSLAPSSTQNDCNREIANREGQANGGHPNMMKVAQQIRAEIVCGSRPEPKKEETQQAGPDTPATS